MTVPLPRSLRWLYFPPKGRGRKRSTGEIVAWWEKRRLAYNIIVGVVGFCCLLAYTFFIENSHVLRLGEDAWEPFGLLAAPIVINICYTAGWAVEALVNSVLPNGSEKRGVSLFKAGLGFSLCVVTLPAIGWGAVWISHVFREMFS